MSLEKARKQFSHARAHSPFYRRHLASFEEPVDKTSWEKLPFTEKSDIAHHNEDFLSIPVKEVAEYVSTSGTLGKPVLCYLSAKDLERLSRNERQSLELAGCSSDDLFQLMCTMDKRFMAGMAYYQGVRELGAGILRMGPGSIAQQWESIHRLNVSVIIAVPSFILSLCRHAQKQGFDPNASSVKKAICIGESLYADGGAFSALSARIKEYWNIELISTYASTEGATAFTACGETGTLHVQEDLIYAELVDEDGRPVKDNEIGELVITPLETEAMPLIRYKTGDLCRMFSGTCSCGRSGLRIGPILGRKDQRLKVKGTTLFPGELTELLATDENVTAYLLEISLDDAGQDQLLLRCSLKDPAYAETLSKTIRDTLRVSIPLSVEEENILKPLIFQEHLRKPKRVVDRRR